MHPKDSVWYKHKLTAVCAVVVSLLILFVNYNHYKKSAEYQPMPQQVLLDVYNRPIGEQDLLTDTFHNVSYRFSDGDGATPMDFAKEAMLRLFSYSHRDLRSGEMLNRFIRYMEPSEGVSVYQDQFMNLSHQRIVLAQEGVVRARFIGEPEWMGQAETSYRALSGLRLRAMAHQFTARIIVTTHADDIYPTVYNDVTITVQRALLQDKLHGYQIISMEIR